MTRSYRILQVAQRDFIVQTQGFFGGWFSPDEFTESHRGPGGKSFRVSIKYPTRVLAQIAIENVERAVLEALRNDFPKVVDRGFVANNGQWVPTRNTD